MMASQLGSYGDDTATEKLGRALAKSFLSRENAVRSLSLGRLAPPAARLTRVRVNRAKRRRCESH